VANPLIAVRLAGVDDAEAMRAVTHRAFAARPKLDPPADALADSVDDVRAALRPPGFGVVGVSEGVIIGSLLVRLDPCVGGGADIATIRRVGVLPESRRAGVADALGRAALRGLGDAGVSRVRLLVRAELTANIAWWRARGFLIDHDVPHGHIMSAHLPAPLVVPTAGDMRRLGAVLARHLRAGDVVIASGELGAGKTVLAQGIGAGLGVAGPVTSPTFVLARNHRAAGGPGLTHVDAYRLASAAELEDIDLDAGMADAVTFVEWGAGLAEGLSDERLDVHIERGDSDVRRVYLTPVGRRWREVGWDALAAQFEGRLG
jgi:tRNA threonylcarbamoyladenosine biosynthesis protein TsaE